MKTIKLRLLKKITLIIFGLCIACSIQVSVAQNEHEFAPVGSEWHFGLIYATSLAEHYNTYQCIKDTIIDLKQCKIIHESQSTCNGIYQNVYIYQDSNKVYYKSNSEDFLLLYDFGKTKGESWWLVIKNYDGFEPEYDSLLVTVTDIRDTVIGKDTLSFMNVTMNNSQYWVGFNGKIYKYIGHEHDLFPFIYNACDEDFNYFLRCYEDSTHLLFYDFDTLHACDYSTVGIVNIDNTTSMYIYPNPVDDKLYIKTNNNHIETMIIYDVMGKEILKKQIDNSEIEVDVKLLHSGLYIIKLYNDNVVINKKIMKF